MSEPERPTETLWNAFMGVLVCIMVYLGAIPSSVTISGFFGITDPPDNLIGGTIVGLACLVWVLKLYQKMYKPKP